MIVFPKREIERTLGLSRLGSPVLHPKCVYYTCMDRQRPHVEWSTNNQRVIVQDVPDLHADRTYAYSPRELDVLALKAEGMTRQQIAQALGLSFYTVQNIFGQLSERNRGDGLGNPDFIPMTVAAEACGLLKAEARDILRQIESGEISIQAGARCLFEDSD